MTFPSPPRIGDLYSSKHFGVEAILPLTCFDYEKFLFISLVLNLFLSLKIKILNLNEISSKIPSPP